MDHQRLEPIFFKDKVPALQPLQSHSRLMLFDTLKASHSLLCGENFGKNSYQLFLSSFPSSGSQKNSFFGTSFFHLCTQGTTSFDRRSTSFRAKREDHCPLADTKTMLHSVQMMCFAMMLASPNEVALRANGCSALNPSLPLAISASPCYNNGENS